MKTLDECKKIVTEKRGYSTFETLIEWGTAAENIEVLNEVAELYKNQSIKRDPKVERPPNDTRVLFCFKSSPNSEKSEFFLVGAVSKEGFETYGRNEFVEYGYDVVPYKMAIWWCFIEEIF